MHGIPHRCEIRSVASEKPESGTRPNQRDLTPDGEAIAVYELGIFPGFLLHTIIIITIIHQLLSRGGQVAPEPTHIRVCNSLNKRTARRRSAANVQSV